MGTMIPKPGKTEITRSISPVRLLIVDDRPPAREGLRALLSVIGEPFQDGDCPSIVVIGEACDGTQAITMVDQEHPDVVLMDVRMPGMSGLEAARLMKASWPEIPIILLSFYGVHRADALNAGANSFLLKGCSPEELLKAILHARSGANDNGSHMIKVEQISTKKSGGGKQDG